jgi:hypothetical protein
MRTALAIALIVGSGFAAAACDSSVSPAPPAGRSPTARTLGVFSTKLSSDAREQAHRVLEQDAFRRENRFLDATKPGYLFATTRVEQNEVAAGLWAPEEIFQLGAQLFHVTFTRELGFGGADLPPLARFHTGRRGGPDAYKCATCHWRGGIGGAGDGADNAYLDGDGDRQSVSLERNPPALHGAGLVEILAAEMSRELQLQRAALVDRARRDRVVAHGTLTTKGVSFGALDVQPDGRVDYAGLQGVDADLVVKPFGWKGTFSTIRDAVEDALNVHHGMQTEFLAAHATPERVGSGGGDDPDGDGVVREITEGQTSVLTLFVAMQEVPQTIVPHGLQSFLSDADFATYWATGRAIFDRIGCAECHRPALKLESTVFHLPSRVGGKEISVDLARDAAEPRIAPRADGSGIFVDLFSDLRRHDVGPALAESRADRGVAPERFLTRPLWGLGRSRPYLHDGRTPLAEEAILAHAGEAYDARNAFILLKDSDKAAVRTFLAALGRARRVVAP